MPEASLLGFADPRANYLAHREEIDSAVTRVLAGGRYILGPEVAAFEREFAAWLGVPEVVGVASGTDALHLALRACGVGAGDGVVTVSHTAVATVAAIEMAGAVPVLVDVDPDTFTMAPEHLAAVLRHPPGGVRLRTILPVHLYGHPADLTALVELAHRHNLKVVEDCAQAHGARLRGRLVGTWGDCAAFSFYPTKNLGALGDGGAIAAAAPQLAARARRLREYGWGERYVSVEAGFNSRLDEMQAAILRVKLKYLEAENQLRCTHAEAYCRLLRDTALSLPISRPEVQHVYHLFVVQHPQRDPLRAHLQALKIGTAIHYPLPVHLQPAYQGRLPIGPGGLAQTEALCQAILSLPMHPQLLAGDIQRVASAVQTWRPPEESRAIG